VSFYRAGGRCPIEDCPFAFAIEVLTEEEADIIAVVATQAHSDHAHGGVPVTLYDVPVLPGRGDLDRDTDIATPAEERPKLVN
jgi:glyoxylase-like metal-dependent hydrolase (beta-lactamase superfamily II)